MKTVAQCVEQLVRMASLATQTSETLDELHNIDRELGIDYFDEKFHSRKREINVSEEMMQRFIESLNIETLQRLQALMYSGRNGESPIDLKHHFVKDSKEEIIRTICEKRPALSVYLPKGLTNASSLGIDIETF